MTQNSANSQPSEKHLSVTLAFHTFPQAKLTLPSSTPRLISNTPRFHLPRKACVSRSHHHIHTPSKFPLHESHPHKVLKVTKYFSHLAAVSPRSPPRRKTAGVGKWQTLPVAHPPPSGRRGRDRGRLVSRLPRVAPALKASVLSRHPPFASLGKAPCHSHGTSFAQACLRRLRPRDSARAADVQPAAANPDLPPSVRLFSPSNTPLSPLSVRFPCPF